MRRDNPTQNFIDVLQRLAAGAGADGASVGELVDRLDERAFGMLILLLAIPCLVPGLPGAQIIAIPIFLLFLQILLGRREPWLPGWFLRARVQKGWLTGIAGFADKRLRWSERLSRARASWIASGFGERVVALIGALAAITIMLPITNTAPSTAVTLIAIGLIQRDGWLTLAGATLALAWVSLLALVVGGLALGIGFVPELLRAYAPWLLEWLTGLGLGAAS